MAERVDEHGREKKMANYFGNGKGGRGAVVLYALKVSPGQQFPVVVGGGGSGGAFINVWEWRAEMNGGTGGTSSFGTVAVGGGAGGSLNTNGTDAAATDISGDGNHLRFQIGLTGQGGTPDTTGAGGGWGTQGFVGVMW